MDLNIWFTYVATAIIFSISPGSGTVNAMTNGLNYNWKQSFFAVIGLQVGLAFHIVFVGVGIGALIAHSATAFLVIQWIGVIYLVGLGIQKWRSSPPNLNSVTNKHISIFHLVGQAVLVNLLNPKSVIFLVALFPQFIDQSHPQTPQFIILGVTTICIDMIVMMSYTVLAIKVKRWIQSERAMTRLNKVFGSAFIFCGALLASAKA